MKFRNITTAYLARKEMAVKATSLNNYRQILRNHLLPEFGERKEKCMRQLAMKSIFVRWWLLTERRHGLNQYG